MKPKAVSLSGQRSRAAFSLIELLTVIAIIAILAGLLLTTSGFIQEKAGNARAQGEIQALSSALEAYKTDYGSYPAEDKNGTKANGSDASSLVLLNVLNRDPGDAKTKVYYEIPANMLPVTNTPTASYETKLKNATVLQDPFGNPYHYQFPGQDFRSGVNFFDLWSKGKKNIGADNAQDDVTVAKWLTNWTGH
jgi:prepilin-type N-terminal cleavage/methylation domain-containing protein